MESLWPGWPHLRPHHGRWCSVGMKCGWEKLKSLDQTASPRHLLGALRCVARRCAKNRAVTYQLKGILFRSTHAPCCPVTGRVCNGHLVPRDTRADLIALPSPPNRALHGLRSSCRFIFFTGDHARNICAVIKAFKLVCHQSKFRTLPRYTPAAHYGRHAGQ